MAVELGGEDLQRAADEADRAVRVVAGAAAEDQAGPAFEVGSRLRAVLAGEAAAATAASDLAADGFADGVKLPAIAAGKSRAGEAAGVGAALAHQVHGAMGFTYEHRLHFLTKRLWSWRDEYGTEAEWSLLLGRHAALAGADRLWAEITTL